MALSKAAIPCLCGCGLLTDRRSGYRKEHRIGAVCSVESCLRKATKQSWCEAHYQRMRKNGDLDPSRPVTIRKGRYITSDGYVVVPQWDHPNAQKNGSIFEHILVMSKTIGRPLLPGETVHHKNGVRDDNRPNNLELWSKKHPNG